MASSVAKHLLESNEFMEEIKKQSLVEPASGPKSEVRSLIAIVETAKNIYKKYICLQSDWSDLNFKIEDDKMAQEKIGEVMGRHFVPRLKNTDEVWIFCEKQKQQKQICVQQTRNTSTKNNQIFSKTGGGENTFTLVPNAE